VSRRPTSPEVELTHGSRAVFPKSGITKRDVFEYYRAVAGPLAAALDGRPIGVQQWPDGIHKPGFFRQEIRTAPPWAKVVPVEHESRTLHKLVIDRPETILWLANQSALTLHTWSSRIPHLSEPDWVVFDLDPGTGPWDDVIQVAGRLRGLLEQLGLASVPKTSGQRGLHVLVPVARGHTYDDVIEFAVAVTSVMAKGLSQIATVERAKSRRHGRLYLDAFQNGWGKTLVAPYSLRAVEGAPVSTPLRWSEVTAELNPSALDLREVPRRLDKHGDLFAPALAGNQRLPRFR
jgi:bifunctional non-homologous end joining protein LigD